MTDRDWDTLVNGWRCSPLRIPGAIVDAVFVDGSRVDQSWYEIVPSLSFVRWVKDVPGHPYEATIAITLSEDLTAKELTVFWKKLALLLPFLAAIIVALISAAVTLRTHNTRNSEGDDIGTTVITGSTPVNDPSTATHSEGGKSVVQTSAPNAAPPVIVQIYIRLQSGVDTPRFVARPHVGDDVVEGLPGRYYLIRLKDADARELVFFAGGKYKKDEMGAELNAAIDAFRKDVTNALASGGVHFEMFVRGSADIVANDKEYLGLLLPGDSKTIEYYPALDELHNVFSRQQKVRVINKAFANRDLPDLRAAYIRDRLQQSGLRATVLEGLVTKQRSDSDRNVTLLLFVAWPSGVETSGPA